MWEAFDMPFLPLKMEQTLWWGIWTDSRTWADSNKMGATVLWPQGLHAAKNLKKLLTTILKNNIWIYYKVVTSPSFWKLIPFYRWLDCGNEGMRIGKLWKFKILLRILSSVACLKYLLQASYIEFFSINWLLVT